MKSLLIALIILSLPLTFFPQEKKDKESLIKSYELQKDRKFKPSKRNPFLKKEEIIITEVKIEDKKKEEEKVSNLPRLEFKGFLTSKQKKMALISIEGVEAIVEEGEEMMNLKILSIKENEIEVLYLLTNENLKIPFTGGE